ncbi:MAG: DUF6383 domain-containing protein [Bacteroidales bacterium]|nr:DUF6383 domain-containing protein [Bacteroidales bacterium]MDD3891985.1 DUF6383 domain-containing protein [Bacteroidales bacterium]
MITASSEIKIFNRGESVVVENAAQGKVISVYTITGSLSAQRTVTHCTEQITVPNGIYIVRVGQYTKKIVL